MNAPGGHLSGSLTLASYNIHVAIGTDGRFDPARIAAVLGELDADVVALQEVQFGPAPFDMLAFLRGATGYEGDRRADAPGPPRRVRQCGADAPRPSWTCAASISACARREPRGALDVTLLGRRGPLRDRRHPPRTAPRRTARADAPAAGRMRCTVRGHHRAARRPQRMVPVGTAAAVAASPLRVHAGAGEFSGAAAGVRARPDLGAAAAAAARTRRARFAARPAWRRTICPMRAVLADEAVTVAEAA